YAAHQPRRPRDRNTGPAARHRDDPMKRVLVAPPHARAKPWIGHGLQIALQAIGLLAASLWLGGIVVLGAVVAPAVFRIVHAPDSADAMTIVFLTLDKVALRAAVVVAVTEVV